MANSDNQDYDRPIPQAKLKEALIKELAVLGKPIQDIVFEQLLRHGITFADDIEASYSIRQLQTTFGELFGKDAASLMMEWLHKILPSGNDSKSETKRGSDTFLI